MSFPNPSSLPDESTIPTIRLFQPPTEELAPPSVPPKPSRKLANGLFEGMRLREFFEIWYRPVLLRKSTQGTLERWYEAIVYWEKFTTNPPLEEIDQVLLANFADKVEHATYKRGINGKERPLAESTSYRHLKLVRAILMRAGPTFDARKPSAGLLELPLYFLIDPPETELKEHLSVEQSIAVVAQLAKLGLPKCWAPYTELRWRVLLGLQHYCSIRVGTVFKVKWLDLKHAQQPWLHIPGERVSKTSKRADVAVHPLLYEALCEWRDISKAANIAPIFPRDANLRWLSHLHDRAQIAAGIENPFGWHVWRRTNAARLGDLGLDEATRIAQAGLDHSSDKTTKRYYLDLSNRLRLKIPNIWEPRRLPLFPE